jgi:homeobox-leucine zipper protein
MVLMMFSIAQEFTLPEGKRSIVKASHRIDNQKFCGILSMSGKLDFPQLSEVNNSGPGLESRFVVAQPCGMILSACCHLSLASPTT